MIHLDTDMTYIAIAWSDKCYSESMNKRHGEDGGLICLGELARDRCLEEFILELRPEADVDVLWKESLKMVHDVNSTVFLDCSLSVFLEALVCTSS